MFIQTISPVLLDFGILKIRWYGLFYAIALLIGYYLGSHILIKKKVMSADQAQETFLYATIGVLVGARIGSIISDLPYYLAQPIKVFAIWEGGLAFHGGLVGGVVAGYIFCKRHKINFFEVIGISTMVALPGLALGRVGNFINAEFYGTVTSLPWGVVFPGVDGPRHPVQLYESIGYLAIFVIMWKFKDKVSSKQLFGMFLSGYALLRFPLEYLKDPTGITHIGILTWGQFWNIPMFVLGIWLMFFVRKKK